MTGFGNAEMPIKAFPCAICATDDQRLSRQPSRNLAPKLVASTARMCPKPLMKSTRPVGRIFLILQE